MSPARIREPVLEVDGRAVGVLECGSGPPLVLVHGLGLAASCWRPHLPRLAAAGFRVVAPDLPGFGRSEGHALTVPATAEWLVRFADAARIRSASWVGHSVSTQALVRLAVIAPARVRALVLAAPTGGGRGARRAGRQLVRLGVDAFREDPRLVARIVGRYFRAPLTTIGTWLRARGHHPDRDAPGVNAPVLLVLGTEDPVVEETYARVLQSRLPQAHIRRLEGAAHAVALDPHDAFCDVVAAFVRG